MGNSIVDLHPDHLWANFHALTQIPRPSKHEEEVIGFVKQFGEKFGFETLVDPTGNVIISKPATPGFENRKVVVLQSHLDMVPQKNEDKIHDFTKDPIETLIDGEWVTANDTTLGADNGIGVAAILSVLASDKIKHGPIEALLTVDEETGMTGAFGLKPGLLKGEILLNLDSEDEGELFIGCAGGIETTALFNYKKEPAPANFQAIEIKVKGLKGGHSGLDIHLPRGNANIILSQLLIQVKESMEMALACFNGGSLRNAIPREAAAHIAVSANNVNALKQLIASAEEHFKKTFSDAPNLQITLAEVEMPDQFIENDTVDCLLQTITDAPNGVIKMMKDFEGVVETSSNLAIVETNASQISVALLHRSSSDEEKQNVCKKVRELFEKSGASVQHSGAYPGWQPRADSGILDVMKKVYETNYKTTPKIKMIHAGLECGIIGAAYPKLDMISFGPTICFPHSPDEKVHIGSVARFWDYLVNTLNEIPEK